MLQKIVLLVAVCTVAAHNILPHFHFSEMISTVQQHHHPAQNGQHTHEDGAEQNCKDHHPDNPFSFVELDNEFIPAKETFKKNELPVQYLPELLFQSVTERCFIYAKLKYSFCIEYPPPDTYLTNLPTRAPPAFDVS